MNQIFSSDYRQVTPFFCGNERKKQLAVTLKESTG
jgi:hypothetical protein